MKGVLAIALLPLAGIVAQQPAFRAETWLLKRSCGAEFWFYKSRQLDSFSNGFKWHNSAMANSNTKQILAIACPTCGAKPGEKWLRMELIFKLEA